MSEPIQFLPCPGRCHCPWGQGDTAGCAGHEGSTVRVCCSRGGGHGAAAPSQLLAGLSMADELPRSTEGVQGARELR